MRFSVGTYISFEAEAGDRALRVRGQSDHRVPLRAPALGEPQFALVGGTLVLRVSEADSVEIQHEGGNAHFRVDAAETQIFGMAIDHMAFTLDR